MNYLSSWPFVNNSCSLTKWQLMNRISSWTFMRVSFVVQECSWTVHEHIDKLSWTFITFCSRTFMNYSWMFMNSSWSSHLGIVGYLHWINCIYSMSSRISIFLILFYIYIYKSRYMWCNYIYRPTQIYVVNNINNKFDGVIRHLSIQHHKA